VAALAQVGWAEATAASADEPPSPVLADAPPPEPIEAPPLTRQMTADREPETGQVVEPAGPKPEAAVNAIPPLPARPDDVTTDRGFPASALQVGGGVSEFSLGQMRSEATRGPYWDVRGVIGLRRLIAFEAAVVGAAYPMAGARYGQDAILLRNGFEAGPRINIPVEEKAGLLLLYGTAGLGLSNYRVARAATRNGMAASDYAATVPLAAGLTMGYERFLVDVRVGYRFTFRDQMAAPPPGDDLRSENRLRDYSFGAQLGYEF
jgi:hypothetical protein